MTAGDDLAVGDPGAEHYSGAVGVLYGSDGGIAAAGGAWLTEDTPGVPGQAEPNHNFGAALAAG